MSIESFIGGLTQSEKLQAMELIWQDLARRTPAYVSPAWHEKVLAERMENPDPGKSVGLDVAKSEIRANLNARRTQG